MTRTTKNFQGLLTLDHMATHIPHTFDLPEGVGTLKVHFSHAPHHPGVGDIPHQFSISVYGPKGARGTRHNNADQTPVISTHKASPGYLAGPIEAGEWRVEIDVHRILPPGQVTYQIDIEWSEEELEAEATPPTHASQKRRGPGWYKGDLHGHTLHSDGRLSVEQYLDLALSRGYDFVALTDHNTVSALPELETRAGEAITILRGEELTTYNGHAVVLGDAEWVDWTVRDGQTMSGRATDLMQAGRLFIIAHPKSEGHPFCTGCRWAFSDLMPGPARHVEVWNSVWDDCPKNEGGVALYYRWLNKGYPMIATCGTDTHGHFPDGVRIGFNMVNAMDNTEDAILAAIKLGHSYISSGPELTVEARQGAKTADMGECLPSGEITLTCTLSEQTLPDGLTLRLISKGQPIASEACTHGQVMNHTLKARNGDWFVWELRDSAGDLHTLTNAIRIGDHWKH